MAGADTWEMQCPKCGEWRLGIQANVSVRLDEDGTDCTGGNEWGDNSDCWCDCGWEGEVGQAEEAYRRGQRGESEAMEDMVGAAAPVHPLGDGSRVLSIFGEMDCDDKDNDRHTGPMAVGEVDRVDKYDTTGWTYGVHFRASGVYVTIDESELAESSNYAILKPGEEPPEPEALIAEELGDMLAAVRDMRSKMSLGAMAAAQAAGRPAAELLCWLSCYLDTASMTCQGAIKKLESVKAKEEPCQLATA